MEKHPETSMKGPTAGMSMMVGTMAVRDHDTTAMRRWINGFN